MKDEIEIPVKMFGAFRGVASTSEVNIRLMSGSTAADVKAELGRLFRSSSASYDVEALLSKSAVASESQILEESEVIQTGMRLAILPPVCGG